MTQAVIADSDAMVPDSDTNNDSSHQDRVGGLADVFSVGLKSAGNKASTTCGLLGGGVL